MEKPFNEMTRIEKSNYRKKLIENNKNYCIGPLCNGKVKPINEFHKNQYKYCKQCKSVNAKKSRDKVGRAFQREKFKLKLDKVCESCNCDDIELLEFDHKDMNDKSFTIAKSGSAEKIIKEAMKTRLLCVWCHRMRTQKDIEKNVKKSRKDYEYSAEEDTEKIDLFQSKKCSGEICNGKIRNYNKFYFSNNRYSIYCKKCVNYNGLLKRRDNADIVDNEKLKIGNCKLCDKKATKETLCCFDFDHLDQKTKKYNVSDLRLLATVDKKIIMDEIAKCQLLCCICHKKKTIKQLKYKTADDFEDKLSIQFKQKQDLVVLMCPICNKNEICKQANMCINCASLKQRKVTRPPFETLESEVAEHGFVQIGKKYNVTDNAVRNWLKWYVLHENKTLTKIQMKI